MSENKSWIKGIDSIRFFLALIVLLSHIHNPYTVLLKNSGNPILSLLSGVVSHLFFGVGSVIAFFVISGFVIHYPNRNKESINVKNFLIRRWIRIGGPLLVIGVIAYYFHIFHNIPIWSLYCEIIYYTLYPLLFNMKVSWKWKFIISFILSYIVIILLNRPSLQSLIHQSDMGYNINYWQLGETLTWLIGLPCWLLGVLLAERIDKINYTVSTPKIYFYRLGTFVAGMVVFMLATHFYVSTIFSLNIFAFVISIWLEKEVAYYNTHSPVKAFEYFGKFSYSLYMCHQLCFLIIQLFIPFNVYTYILYIILSLCISYVVYLTVEYPSSRLAQRLGSNNKKGLPIQR